MNYNEFYDKFYDKFIELGPSAFKKYSKQFPEAQQKLHSIFAKAIQKMYQTSLCLQFLRGSYARFDEHTKTRLCAKR